jgi:DNA-binding NtrC family response regulator
MGAPQAEYPTTQSSPKDQSAERHRSQCGPSARIVTEIKRVVTGALTSRRILVVAADPGMRMLLRYWLEKEDFTVDEVPDLEGAVDTISNQRIFSAIICDQRLEDGDGLQFMQWLRKEVFTIPFLLITGWRIPGLIPRWGFDYLITPFDSETLCTALRQILDDEIDDRHNRKASAMETVRSSSNSDAAKKA